MTLEEFVVKIGFNINPKGIEEAGRQVEGAASRWKVSFSDLAGLAGKVGLAFSAWQIPKYAIQSAAQLERLQAQFEVMLGSAGKAERMIADIQKLAAATPLESMGITESVKTLVQFGVAGENAIDTVRQLGDVAGGDQERLSRMALAYGQVVAAGKLQGQDLLQFINAGFNPLKVMVENATKFGLKAGTSMGDLRKMMEKGQISAEMMGQAFVIATSKGGMFYQNMEKQSKTLGGLWSTMVDNIQLSLVAAVQPLIPMLKELVDWVGQIDWKPLVAMIQTVANAMINYVIPSAKIFVETLGEMVDYLIPISILLIGAFGPRMWAMLLKTELATKAITFATAAYQTLLRILGIEAATQAGQAVTANMAVATSWGYVQAAAMRAGDAMKTAMLGLLNPLTVVMVGLLGIWALYEKTKNLGEIDQEDAKNDMTLISAYNRNRSERGLQALYAQRAAMEKRFQETGGIDGGKMKDLNEKIRLAELVKEDYEKRYERQFGKKPGGDYGLTTGGFDLEKLYQDMFNNTKKVTNNINNQITIPTTIDTKGETPLTPSAVQSIADMAVRSALNVQLLGVIHGV